MATANNNRRYNRPPVPPPALTPEDVAAIDVLVHELGARQWKIGIRIGCSPITVANAVKRKGAYKNIPPYQPSQPRTSNDDSNSNPNQEAPQRLEP